MHPHYKHLTVDDRLLIDSLLGEGLSLRAVAARVGVHASTVCRERQRGLLPGFNRYLAAVGQHTHVSRRKRASLSRRKLGIRADGGYWPLVLPYLCRGWSPQQIAGRLHSMPDSPSISHKTIYAAIYAMSRGALRTELVSLLRKSHAGRLPCARGSARFTGLQNMAPIGLRPPEVDSRTVSCHWKADLIKGARNASAVGTLVERTSRYIVLAKLNASSSNCALEAFTRRLKPVPHSLRKTLTYDQGTEMALHETLARRLKIDICFCDPHSPWQRTSTATHSSTSEPSSTRSTHGPAKYSASEPLTKYSQNSSSMSSSALHFKLETAQLPVQENIHGVSTLRLEMDSRPHRRCCRDASRQ